MTIDMEVVELYKKLKEKINAADIAELVVMEGGEEIKIDPEVRERFRITGLTVWSFLEMRVWDMEKW
ncbi:hypothetical protein AYO40_03545 [Planctomycetaceae bacterium SCGC AG-212-D15]|nr:hypothetical protein AYO40_03545 [Planctomycetaceae bacterium SCGC AG-212-D15]